MRTPAIYALESKPLFAAVRLRNETYQPRLTSASKAPLQYCARPDVRTLCQIPLRDESAARVIVFFYFWETPRRAVCGAERVSERRCPPGPASQQL